MFKRRIPHLGIGIDQHRVPLVERAALRVLPGKTHRSPIHQQRSIRQQLRRPIVERPLTPRHLQALFIQLLHLRMNMKILRILCHQLCEFKNTLGRDTSLELRIGLRQLATLVRFPVVWKLSQVRLVRDLRSSLLLLEERLLRSLRLGSRINADLLSVELMNRRTVLDGVTPRLCNGRVVSLIVA